MTSHTLALVGFCQGHGWRSLLAASLLWSSSAASAQSGDSLTTLKGSEEARQGPRVATTPRAVPQTVYLRDVNFRPGPGLVGRVVVDLEQPQGVVDVRQQGQSLVVDFAQTALPQGLRRQLDVSEWGTPVQTITMAPMQEGVRMVIVTQGPWAHTVQHGEEQLVLELREPKNDAMPVLPHQQYTGAKISLNFQAVEVRSLLQVIADFTQSNLVASDAVSGSLTLRLKDVPWDQALDIILQIKGLGMRKMGQVMWIAPQAEIAARELQELQARAAIENLEAVRTQGFQLNYARAAELAQHLSGGGAVSGAATPTARILSPRGSLMAEPRTNQLFVTDVPARLAQIQALLAQLDIPIRQVLIEARIVEADDRFARSLGVRLGASDGRGLQGGAAGIQLGSGTRMALGASYNALSSTTGETGNALDTVNTSFVNLPSLGLGGYSPASMAVSLFSSAANRFLNLEISALEADGRGRIVSSPRVVTADQVKALIEQGTEYPYQIATSGGATAIAFRKANLKLEVTPQITPEGGIILDVDINKDSRGETTASGIAINTKHIQTQVLVQNGGTAVIGGIFELIEIDSVTQVPILGDVPFVGHLFKNRSKNTSKSELLVFLTPRVITDRGLIR
jgi:type IV pilus assembly protein PilQ